MMGRLVLSSLTLTALSLVLLSPSGLIEHYGLWVGLILLVFWGVVTTRKQYDLYLQYRVILTPDEALRLARRERR